MQLLNIKKLNYISKRYMETTTTKPKHNNQNIPIENNIENKPTVNNITHTTPISVEAPPINEENPIPAPAIDIPKPTTEASTKTQFDQYLNEQELRARQMAEQELRDRIYNTHNETLPSEPVVIYNPILLSPEALKADVFVKTTVEVIDELGTRLGKTINKSDELAKSWNLHLKNYDEYIKSLKKFNWTKAAGWSLGLLIVGGFLWKMGAMRAIPNFASGLIKLIPMPEMNTTTIIKETPKPKIDATITAIMETPLTPLAIITGVGLLSISLGILKATLWVLRKAPK